MNIGHEIKDVRVVRHPTIAGALAAGLGRKFVVDTPASRGDRVLKALRLARKAKERSELSELLHEPLWKEYEGESTYEWTLALVSLETDMCVSELYLKLFERHYRPASLSEAMCYLPMLTARQVEVDFVFHLGFMRCNEYGIEQRLITRKSGSVEPVPFHRKTTLKPYYHIVVAKDE